MSYESNTKSGNESLATSHRNADASNKETPPVSEKAIYALLTRAQHYEFCRQVEKGLKTLSPLWKNLNEYPLIKFYSLPVQAEILLRCGSMLSYISHFKQLPYQEMARQWLMQSAELFESVKNPDKVAEAETDLGMAYWREGKYKEARVWMERGFAKIDNENNSVYIKNISYQIINLSMLGTGESLQAAMALIKDKDIYAELSADSRVKVHYYNNSAIFLARIGNHSDALDRYKTTLQLCKEVGNLYGQALAENNIGYLYKRLGIYDKALAHVNTGLKMFIELEVVPREGDCYESLAQIHIERGDLGQALKFAEKAVKVLSQFGAGQVSVRIDGAKAGDYPSLIAAMHTKARILLKMNKTDKALRVFSEYMQLARTQIGESTAEGYSEAFSELIFPKTDASLVGQTAAIEKAMVEEALNEFQGNVNKAAQKLDVTEKNLKKILSDNYPHLLDKYNIDPNAKKISGINFKEISSLKKSDGLLAARADRNLVEFEYQNKPAFIPSDIEAVYFITITDPMLPSFGLIEGRVGVVSNQFPDRDDLPTALQVFLSGDIYYGKRTNSCGLIGVEADDTLIYPPKAFMPENVEILGHIVGYLEFNFTSKFYEYFPLEKTAK